MKRILASRLFMWVPLLVAALYLAWAVQIDRPAHGSGYDIWLTSLSCVALMVLVLTVAVHYFQRELRAHHRTEEQLRQRQQLDEALLRQLPTAVYLIDLADITCPGRILEANEAACRNTRYQRTQLVGRSIALLDAGLSPSPVPRLLAEVEKQGRIHFEGVNRRSDGSLYPVNVVVQRVELNHQRYCLAIEEDISERKASESCLRDSEERYRMLAEYSTDVISRSTLEGEIRYVSPACRQALGYEPEEMLGQMFHSFHHPEDLKALLAQPNPVLSGADCFTLQYRARRKEGTYVWMETSVRMRVDPQTNQPVELIAVARDISKRHELEEQLQQAAKMEAIGRLAGGVAHDFNNLLTVIGGFSSLLLQEAAPGSRQRELLRQVQSASERAATLTRQLLAFSRKQILQPTVLDLNSALQTLHSLIGRLIGETITVELDLAASVPAVRVDPGQIDQVILNLAMNARDAMPGGGKLTLRTRLLENPATAPHPEVPPGNWVLLQVSDTGSGIAPDVLPYIFEPFFTTKEVGQGSGLGLASVYGVVKQSEGHIFVDSVAGQGTTFALYFPALSACAQKAHPSGAEKPAQPRGETILLVEDEDQVRQLTRMILEQQGYRVLEAHDGPSALKLSHEHTGDIDLTLTDVVMPALSGPEFVHQLRRERPRIKVIYMSGYSEGEQARQNMHRLDAPLVAKPFSPRALAECVRQQLAGNDQPQGRHC